MVSKGPKARVNYFIKKKTLTSSLREGPVRGYSGEPLLCGRRVSVCRNTPATVAGVGAGH